MALILAAKRQSAERLARCICQFRPTQAVASAFGAAQALLTCMAPVATVAALGVVFDQRQALAARWQARSVSDQLVVEERESVQSAWPSSGVPPNAAHCARALELERADHCVQHAKWRTQGGAPFSLQFNLETAVGRARVGRDAVRWQGATTRRAHAREEEQRRQRAAARLNRVRSALTQTVRVVVGRDLSIHAV